MKPPYAINNPPPPADPLTGRKFNWTDMNGDAVFSGTIGEPVGGGYYLAVIDGRQTEFILHLSQGCPSTRGDGTVTLYGGFTLISETPAPLVA